MITSRSTKAEILAAYQALKVQQKTEVVTWPLIVNSATIIIKELNSFISDVSKISIIGTRWIQRVISELKQPIFHTM